MVTDVQYRPGKTGRQQLFRKQLIPLGILFVGCVCVLFQIDLQTSSELLAIDPPSFKESYIQRFLVNTKGCRIQDLDPFDQSIREFIFDEKPVICNKDNVGMLVKATGNTLYVDLSVISKYNLTEDTVNCCYRPFWRQELPSEQIILEPNLADRTVRYANYCVPFMSSTIKEQFVAVTCQLLNDSYRDYFNFVHLKEEESVNQGQEKISVLLIGVDSVSRLNLHRQMPKTVKFLKQTVKTVEMLGYNKVGDNTFPNLIPVLVGVPQNYIKMLCSETSFTGFDKCPFIWNYFKKSGFITGFAEDIAEIGMFHVTSVGFRKQPTDFYLNPFIQEAETNIGHETRLRFPLCLGKRLSAEVLLDTISQFAINLKNRHSFGFFWETSLTHDYLNLPKYGDDYYFKLFSNLYEQGIFNNSMVIFFSDHGLRWGKFRNTYEGFLEERLPFLFISYPNWFAEKFPHAVHNLQANRKKLTSPYDLHATLMDLVDLKNITNVILRNRLKLMKNSIGNSLFLPIAETRTCSDAGVNHYWCTCHQSFPASTNDIKVKQSAISIVTYLNKLLEGYAQCRKLNLNKIMSAQFEEIPLVKYATTRKYRFTDYIVTIETVPGKGLFQAAVRYMSNNSYAVVSHVSRINMYGNQSYCISHYLLKLYCFCNSFWHW